MIKKAIFKKNNDKSKYFNNHLNYKICFLFEILIIICVGGGITDVVLVFLRLSDI
jgi:hypothetical protein